MGDSVEDLLAQMKAQYAEMNQSDASPQPDGEQSLQPPRSQQPSAQQPPSTQLSGRSDSGSIDDLLAKIEGKPQSPRLSQPSLPPIPSQSNWQQTEFQSTSESAATTNQQLQSHLSSPHKLSTDRLLQDLKTQYDEHDQAEELRQQEQRRIEEQKHQEQLRQEQRRQTELKRQKQLAAAQQAEEWLKRLDPRSGEAAWFEEFAAKYESRLEAAIDYLGLEEQ